MSEKKSSRTFINLLGIPSILAIIVAGDICDKIYHFPLFSLFIGIVLYLGAKEFPVLIKGSNGMRLDLIVNRIKYHFHNLNKNEKILNKDNSYVA